MKNEPRAVDYGESAVRWVICDQTGTQFFVDKQGRILVFTSKDVAQAAATLDVFRDQGPNEINVAGVGATKWQKIQDTLSYVEVVNDATATALINERIAHQTEQLGLTPPTVQEFPDTPPASSEDAAS